MKIAILTKPDNRSPRVLAEAIKLQLQDENVLAEVFDEIRLLNRLVSYRQSKLSYHFWLLRKIRYYLRDKRLIKKLRHFDAVIISECSPNSFSRNLYNVEKFKKLVGKSVLLYEVYYLGNTPNQVDLLKDNSDPLQERYDFHLSVSDVTEIKQPPSDTYYPIGLYAKSWNLTPALNQEITAILDFEQLGYEEYRTTQIKALQKAGIKYISLEGSYTIEQIRHIYRRGSLYFMQSSEAFGVPILECLCCGCQIFTPHSWWAMSWRLDEEPAVHAEGKLASCFTIYRDEDHLVEELQRFKQYFNALQTPANNFKTLLQHYPSFYYGNKSEIQCLLKMLKKKERHQLDE